MASSPLAAKSTGSCPTACTASEWIGTPYARATAASSAIGCTVPTSLFAHITVTSATDAGVGGDGGLAASRGATRPAASTGSHSTARPRARPATARGSRTAWCSTALARMRRRAGSSARRAQNRPLTARLSASVPPPVKTTSLGRAPSAAASVSRASSTSRRAARPEACSDDGLPTMPRHEVIASTASGSIGVVAAWSR